MYGYGNNYGKTLWGLFSYLLQENGDALLQENDDEILL